MTRLEILKALRDGKCVVLDMGMGIDIFTIVDNTLVVHEQSMFGNSFATIKPEMITDVEGFGDGEFILVEDDHWDEGSSLEGFREELVAFLGIFYEECDEETKKQGTETDYLKLIDVEIAKLQEEA